ncbi:MAG TPA: glycerate kinase [Candidatus Elarobacter sp.]|nr:glycerate kinase [Candidatus Elarobacter sp.]
MSKTVRALACPASLKGVLSPIEAAAHLAAGLTRVDGVEADEAPVADGGEGTAEVIAAALGGEWRTAVVSDPLGRAIGARWLLLPDGTAVVEAAEAIGLPRVKPEERNPLAASSWGLGELLVATLVDQPTSMLVCVGGTATVDGGAAMLAVVGSWLSDIPIRVACDVRNPLLGERGAARVFGPQKGADEDAIEELEDRISRMARLQPYRDLPGAGAGGGLGAAFASLGGELLAGAELVMRLIHFDERASGAALAVTGEGTVDATTFEGKAPGAVLERCDELGVRCELFGGLVAPGCDARALSGDPSLAAEDLVQLGEELALTLVS